MESEIWKIVDRFSNYEVSSNGRVRNLKSGKFLKGKKNKKGYIEVILYAYKIKGYLLVHRLVAEAFIEKPSYYAPFVNHKNSIRDDNRKDNLEWCNHSQNMRHAYELGRNTQKGERNSCAKINMEIAILIRKYAEENSHLSKVEIANHFNITRSIVKDVISLRSWNY